MVLEASETPIGGAAVEKQRQVIYAAEKLYRTLELTHISLELTELRTELSKLCISFATECIKAKLYDDAFSK